MSFRSATSLGEEAPDGLFSFVMLNSVGSSKSTRNYQLLDFTTLLCWTAEWDLTANNVRIPTTV